MKNKACFKTENIVEKHTFFLKDYRIPLKLYPWFLSSSYASDSISSPGFSPETQTQIFNWLLKISPRHAKHRAKIQLLIFVSPPNLFSWPVCKNITAMARQKPWLLLLPRVASCVLPPLFPLHIQSTNKGREHFFLKKGPENKYFFRPGFPGQKAILRSICKCLYKKLILLIK